MEDNALISVRNRNNGYTGYILQDGAKENRSWAPGETKKITFEELKRVSWLPGGDVILRDYLVIEDKEAAEALNIGIDIEESPEYLYSEADIKKLLLEGSVAELEDFLDFSPKGGIEIAKELAVKLEIPDIRKREVISKATGFNINNAINVNHIMDDDSEEEEKTDKKTRRVKPAETTSGEEKKPVRRTTTSSKYKVID